MMIHPTLETLHELRLRGMATALEEQLQSSATDELSFEERLALLLEREITWRDNRRLQRLLQQARLRIPGAAPEDIDFRSARGLDRSVLLRLASADWVRQHQVVLIVGPTGVGKSYLACAWARPPAETASPRDISGSAASSQNSPSRAPTDRMRNCSRNWRRRNCLSSTTGDSLHSAIPNAVTCSRSWRIATDPRPP